jgi:hypothetical protein
MNIKQILSKRDVTVTLMLSLESSLAIDNSQMRNAGGSRTT